MIAEEISRLTEIGAIQQTPSHHFVSPILVRKSIRTMAPNLKPQEPKHPSDTLPFQDGRVTLHPIHLDTSSLYGQNRSKLWLPHSFRSLYSQEIPPICLKRDYLPIQNLSFGLNIPPFVFTKVQKHVDCKGHTLKRKHDNRPQLELS